MCESTSSFESERASRYLQAMCKHFSHKVQVDYDTERGTAALPYGRLDMHAHDGVLHFRIKAADAVALARLKHVVDAHIVRFAFREKLESLKWS